MENANWKLHSCLAPMDDLTYIFDYLIILLFNVEKPFFVREKQLLDDEQNMRISDISKYEYYIIFLSLLVREH